MKRFPTIEGANLSAPNRGPRPWTVLRTTPADHACGPHPWTAPVDRVLRSDQGCPQPQKLDAPYGRQRPIPRGMPLSIDAALAKGVLIQRSNHPGEKGRLDRLLRTGRLAVVLPGIYVRPDKATDFHTRAKAVCLADPTAALMGAAAVFLHGWQAAVPTIIHVASAKLRVRRPWLVVEARAVPARHTRRVDGIRITSRAMTALDQLPTQGEEALMAAFRVGVSVDEFRLALTATPGRRGNAMRARMVGHAEQQPWSKPEWVGHEALREAGVPGWKGNHKVMLNAADHAVVDIAFPALGLAIEIDGFTYHSDREAFRRDRKRDQRLALLCWKVVRFAADEVLADPKGFAATVELLVAARRRELGGQRPGSWTPTAHVVK